MSLRNARWLWVVMLPLPLLLATAQPVWAADPVTLELQAPGQVTLGEEITVTAIVRDGKGDPVPAATIVFWSPATFLSNSGAVQLGRAATDAQGRASLLYEARTGGTVTVSAYFAGDPRYEPAQASAEMEVEGSAQLTRHPIEGVRAPGIGVWILAAILGGVWSTYFAMMIFLTLIAREGSATQRETEGTHA